VIAETTELPTRYAKVVVTDDRGRHLIPDPPQARYSVWARGYGLVDSVKQASVPGKLVDITAVPAPSEAAAAGDWTDRIANGELPFAKPPRPQGLERNVVITTWDWASNKHHVHDAIEY
jgi:hypothetical protein